MVSARSVSGLVTATSSSSASSPKRVTLKDVARAVEVSLATVSNAYNRPDQLSPQLRSRILETAQALGYGGPDPVASSLRRGRAGAIGVIYDATLSHAFADPAASLFLGGLSKALEEQSLALLLISSPRQGIQRRAGSTDPEGGAAPDRNCQAQVSDIQVPGIQRLHEQSLGVQRPGEKKLPTSAPASPPVQGMTSPGVATRVQSASVDGFIVYCAPDGSELIQEVLRRGLPTVLVDQSPMRGAAHIGIDNAGGAREAARHLLGLGHRQIGVLSLEVSGSAGATTKGGDWEPQTVFRSALERLQAYREVAAGVPGATLHIRGLRGSTQQRAEALALALLAQEPGITALLCMSDVLAQGALSAARTLGLSVPEKLSVVGYDDLPSSAALNLSSVHQPSAQKGELAGRALLELLAGGAARDLILPTRLMVRGSSGPVRKER